MSYVMSPIQDTLADNSGVAAYANLQVGSNGDPSGDPTTYIGDIYGDENWAYDTWDPSVNGGFDTGTLAVSFDLTSDGTENLNVGGFDPLSYEAVPVGPVASVEIDAAVQTNASVTWSDLTVKFLQDGSVIEVDTIGAGPAVNTISSGNNNVAEQILTVTPTMPNADEVVVTGTLRMNSPGITNPTADGMFATILINGANASSSGSGGGIGIGPGGSDYGNG